MTRDDFIKKWQHELAGMVLDGAVNQRTGADLALFCRQIMKRLDAHLSQMHQDAQPVPVNGQPQKVANAPSR